MSTFDKSKSKLKGLMERLSGGFIPELVKKFSLTELGQELNVCE
jgi:hypothetical protein